MKKRKNRTTKFSLGLLLVAGVALCLLPYEVKALTAGEICADASLVDMDYDGDGFTNGQECVGLLLLNGQTFPGYDSQLNRQSRLDPATRDLFVILVRATDQGANWTNIPHEGQEGYFNPLEMVYREPEMGGLGITTHVIPPDPVFDAYDRLVSSASDQKAVKITERLDPEGIILGYANQGTPNGLDDALIYTERIKNHIESVCAEEGYEACLDVSGLTDLALVNHYIKHTIAHEIGHMTRLAPEYDKRFDGYHYKAGSEVVMEQAVLYSSRKGVVTFYISDHYALPSQQSITLK